MKKSPLTAVKERFESKEKLVAAVEALSSSDLWIDRLGEKGLTRVSNAKLLSLHDKLKDAQARFKNRDALVSSLLTLLKRSQDAGLRTALAAYPLPRLLDLHGNLARKAKRSEKAAKA
jgi:hypothetical protein